MKQIQPVYAQCHICYKKYDMVRYGVSCPGCKDKIVKRNNSVIIKEQ
ncbi:MAG: hypothetical protein AABX29_10060 [Nanoarchaeota archaeon]